MVETSINPWTKSDFVEFKFSLFLHIFFLILVLISDTLLLSSPVVLVLFSSACFVIVFLQNLIRTNTMTENNCVRCSQSLKRSKFSYRNRRQLSGPAYVWLRDALREQGCDVSEEYL